MITPFLEERPATPAAARASNTAAATTRERSIQEENPVSSVQLTASGQRTRTTVYTGRRRTATRDAEHTSVPDNPRPS